MNPLLEILQGKKVALDAMVFIYSFEERPVYLPFLKPLWREAERGKVRAVTSTITLAECLVQPFRAKALELAARPVPAQNPRCHPFGHRLGFRLPWLPNQR